VHYFSIWHFIGLTFLLLVAVGCSEQVERRTYQEIHVAVSAPSVTDPPVGQAPVVAKSAELVWALPPGWQEKASAQSMRLVTFSSGADTDGSIVVLPGDVGGEFANVQRWAGQVSVEMSDDELVTFIAEQERLTSAGGFPVLLIDFSRAVEDDSPSMLVAIVELPQKRAFVKLMGAATVLRAESANFRALCASLASHMPSAEEPAEKGTIAWDVPEGWSIEAAQGMRLATLRPAADPDGLCTIIALGGAGGGLEQNVVRWARQLKAELEKPAEFIARQPKLDARSGPPVLLVDLLELQPKQDGPSMLIGVWTLEEQTIFVKFSGSVSFLTRNRQAFRALCRSLRVE